MLKSEKTLYFIEEVGEKMMFLLRYVLLYSLTILIWGVSIAFFIDGKGSGDVLLYFLGLISLVGALIMTLFAIKITLEEYVECQKRKVVK